MNEHRLDNGVQTVPSDDIAARAACDGVACPGARWLSGALAVSANSPINVVAGHCRASPGNSPRADARRRPHDALAANDRSRGPCEHSETARTSPAQPPGGSSSRTWADQLEQSRRIHPGQPGARAAVLMAVGARPGSPHRKQWLTRDSSRPRCGSHCYSYLFLTLPHRPIPVGAARYRGLLQGGADRARCTSDGGRHGQ